MTTTSPTSNSANPDFFMDKHAIIALSEERISQMHVTELREVIRGVDLPLEEIGSLAEQLDQLDRETLVRLLYRVRRQYQQQLPG